MLPIISDKSGEAHLQATMSQVTTLGKMVGLARSGLWALRADLSWGVEDTSATWGLGDLGQILGLGEGE